MSQGLHGRPLHDAAPGDERVSTLVGDRLCIGCAYNLTGQPVVRETHYRMLIVRCPECGMVACLQEYPLLGRWAGRWAALLAALWLVVLLAMVLASGGILSGVTLGVTYSAAAPWAVSLAKRQLEDLKPLMAQGTVSPSLQYYLQEPVTPQSMLQRSWLDQQDLPALLGAAGGPLRVADLGALRNWWWIALAGFPMGCFWAVALLHLRRRGLLPVALVPVATAAAFLAITRFNSDRWLQFGPWVPASDVARLGVGLPFEVATLAFALLPLAAGLLLGRPIVRGLVRALLPPRLRGALVILWTVEGLAPPPSGGQTGTPAG